ncbi:histidine kinase [Paenibacillus sp. HB172176]|uniref:sensor histidine kinase n=1 Tax=Paenibacillus sp. HB172176 TaxID=2493690 RepID=UPI00143A0D7D|nr:histidine kinase [Paenibacillus sp. HB172176]
MQTNISQSMDSNVQYYLGSLEAELQKIIDLKQSYIEDFDFQKLSDLATSMSPFEQTQSILRVQDRLDLVKTSSLYVEEVKVYFPMLNRTISTDNVYGMMDESEVTAMIQAQNNRDTLFLMQDKLVMAQVYPDLDQPPYSVGFAMEIELSVEKIKEQLKRTLPSSGGGAMLMDGGGKWKVVSSGGEQLAGNLNEFMWQPERQGMKSSQGIIRDADGESYFVTLQRSELLNAAVVIGLPKREALSQLEKYRVWYLYQVLLTIVVILFCSYWIYRIIHRPLRGLLKAFRQVERGKLDIRITGYTKDEFKFLYRQFNQMTSRLQHLIQEVYEQQLRSQQSELKQLQSQINPHFLYNSFFILRRMAQIPDLESVKRMTAYLGEYFRFMTRTALDEVKLTQEVGHSRIYADIQSMRFGSKIEVEFEELPEKFSGINVPRLILQPILENAYQHSLEDRVGQGHLRIQYKHNSELLVIRIEDNGDALSDETIKRLNNQLSYSGQNEEVTGLVNVHRRLKLKFGEEGGVELGRSADLGGMLVDLIIPLKQQEE